MYFGVFHNAMVWWAKDYAYAFPREGTEKVARFYSVGNENYPRLMFREPPPIKVHPVLATYSEN